MISFTLIMACRFSSRKPDQKDCGKETTINGLSIYFNDFSPLDLTKVWIKIINIHSRDSDWQAPIPTKALTDHLRNQRYLFLDHKIHLTDTIYVKLANGTIHSIHSFKYQLRPHASMGSVTYSCSFYELYVDHEKQTGGVASIVNKVAVNRQ